MRLSVKKGDNVLVLSGKDAGKTGEILQVNKEDGKVVVANVNIQSHHKKARSKDEKGGIMKSEGPIDVSNVQVICPTCKKATRVGKTLVDGKYVRACKHKDCGATLNVKSAGKIKSTKPASKPVAKTEKKTEKTETVKPVAKTTVKTEKKTETTKPVVKTEKVETKTSKPSTAKVETKKASTSTKKA